MAQEALLVKRFELLLNGKAYLVEVTRISSEGALVIVNGVQYEVGIKDLTKVELPKMMVVSETPAQAAAPVARKPQPVAETVGGVTTVRAPLPGLIIEIKVQVGDTVKAGDVLLVIETMKMENNIVSPCAGTVREVNVTKNQSVNEGAPLIVIGD
ncbi:MAG: biotin/lipoyl-binding protein [Candidatus Abyssobacteria bacterium SURF_17]|uniref:Biotin/lipoyl-binding protein n=1 Tax=Candidatus Abyssobacteria bacterium SURF_17 TaxID=2093361 RepID=A0A419EUL4_9BACT|nr:MAG: biotin/lipoyl-binding protein [Candidatus Abyssubacteria bacterium SURF_17]